VVLKRTGCGLALAAVKRTSCDVWQLECQASNVTGMLKVITFCKDTCFQFQSFSPLINCIVHHAVLKVSPCRNKTLLQLVHRPIADWYSILQRATNAVIYRVEIRAIGWPHVRTDELRCLTTQKLDYATSMMCWRIVLLEAKHVFSNAADHL